MRRSWTKDMGRCLLNGLGECLAEVPEACVCRKMPPSVVEEKMKEFAPNEESR
jgi:hypothetical protein